MSDRDKDRGNMFSTIDLLVEDSRCLKRTGFVEHSPGAMHHDRSTDRSVRRHPCSEILRDGINTCDIFDRCPSTALNNLRRLMASATEQARERTRRRELETKLAEMLAQEDYLGAAAVKEEMRAIPVAPQGLVRTGILIIHWI